jgi:hypothetical protein
MTVAQAQPAQLQNARQMKANKEKSAEISSTPLTLSPPFLTHKKKNKQQERPSSHGSKNAGGSFSWSS